MSRVIWNIVACSEKECAPHPLCHFPPLPSPPVSEQLKGEIDDAGDSLRLLETQDAALQRAKKLYTQSVEQYVKQQKKMDKAKGDTNPKNRQQV